MASSPGSALILGLDTPAGAYLARLLKARGQQVAGLAPGGPALLQALGSADDIALHQAASLPALPGRHASLYIVSTPDPAASALAREALAAAPADSRLIHVVDRALLLTHAPARQLAADMVRLRREAGRFAANAILHPHDSRLGPAEALPARITRAAHAAAAGQPATLILADTPPQDWGWTAEYVDAVARLAALPRATDIEIGSGVAMTARDMVAHAARWFRLAQGQLTPVYTATPVPTPDKAPDTARLRALLGWRATTTGADLMDALCEAAAARAASHGP